MGRYTQLKQNNLTYKQQRKELQPWEALSSTPGIDMCLCPTLPASDNQSPRPDRVEVIHVLELAQAAVTGCSGSHIPATQRRDTHGPEATGPLCIPAHVYPTWRRQQPPAPTLPNTPYWPQDASIKTMTLTTDMKSNEKENKSFQTKQKNMG